VAYTQLKYLIDLVLDSIDLRNGGEFINGKILLETASVYGRVIPGADPEFIQEAIKSHKCWQNTFFWQEYFWAQTTAKFGDEFGEGADASKGWNESETAFWEKEISAFAKVMHNWGDLPFGKHLLFVESLCDATLLGLESRSRVLKNVQEFHKKEEQRFKAGYRKSRMFASTASLPTNNLNKPELTRQQRVLKLRSGSIREEPLKVTAVNPATTGLPTAPASSTPSSSSVTTQTTPTTTPLTSPLSRGSVWRSVPTAAHHKGTSNPALVMGKIDENRPTVTTGTPISSTQTNIPTFSIPSLNTATSSTQVNIPSFTIPGLNTTPNTQTTNIPSFTIPESSMNNLTQSNRRMAARSIVVNFEVQEFIQGMLTRGGGN